MVNEPYRHWLLTSGLAEMLSDHAWADFCAIAGRAGLTPDAEARALLGSLLFREYQHPSFAYDRKLWAERLKLAERMQKRLAAFEADYRALFLLREPDGSLITYDLHDGEYVKLAGFGKRDAAEGDDPETVRDLRSIELLQQRLRAASTVAQDLRRYNAGKKNLRREWVYSRLCDVWFEHFHGELTYSVPPTGGPPYGPLIDFVLAAFRQVVPADELPSPETVRDAIGRRRPYYDALRWWRSQQGQGQRLAYRKGN